MIAVKSDERLNDPICVAFFHPLAAYEAKLLHDVPIVLMNNNNPTYIKLLKKKLLQSAENFVPGFKAGFNST